MTNTLYYGDNLHVLREHIASESVDLIYLDPPFNSNANYNILFKSPEGHDSDAQIEAFEDTWHWNDSAEAAFDEVMRSGRSDAFELLRAMRGFLGDNDMMAYLAMMAVRLIELHRVLKPTGSLYLHCDPTASHYLKLLLDGVFGPDKFRNEIVWERTNAHNMKTKGWTRSNDTIFFYSKGSEYTFNQQYTDYGPEQLSRFKPDENGRLYKAENMTFSSANKSRQFEWRGTKPPENRSWGASLEQLEKWWEEGRILTRKDGSPRMDGLKIYLDETKGKPVATNWADIGRVGNTSGERLGYPTQKPLALLERIIAASSNEGDVVLDPFCGCGTAVHAAQKLGRQWIGIDVTHLAIGLIEKRMKSAFPGIAFAVVGRPQDLQSALDLAERDKHQFELWALSALDAVPWKGGRKGADTGIDGIIYFKPDGKRTEKAIVEVKGGAIGVKDIGRLAQVMEREKAPFGVYLTARAPTRAMESDAAAVGLWENELTGRKHPRLQIITLAELFQGKRPDIPWVDLTVGKSARREETAKQGSLL
jgi:site-specific DNA-methyltransferase (adenine-specific)